MKQYESMIQTNPKLAKQIYDSGLVSEGRKSHYSEDMKQCEKLVNPTITDKNGNYKSYTNKNGIELSYTQRDNTHTDLVKEVISEVIKMCDGCNHTDEISMRIALGSIKQFLKENFDIVEERKNV